MPKKILFPTFDYPPQVGGVANYLSAIKKTFPDNVEILYIKDRLNTIQLFKKIKVLSKEYDEIWTSHVLPIGTACLLVKIFTGKDYSVFLHGLDFDLARRDFKKRIILKQVLRGAKNVITNSQALALEVQRFANLKKIIVVYPAVSDEMVKQSNNTEHNYRKRKLTLLTVGRLVERKGHIKVLEALKDFPNLNYHIVGDGPMYKKIKDKIKEYHLENRVVINQNVTNKQLPEHYQNADIFIMPTTKTKLDREGFGIVYLEAQLYKLPIIATNHPGVDEAVIKNGTGLLIIDHPDALKIAIKKLITDAQLRKRMGEAGRAFVLAGFIRQKQFKKLEEIL